MRIVRLDETSRKNILANLLKRDPNQYGTYADAVQDIIDTVKRDRDKAVFAYTREFDHADIDPSNIRVTEEEMEEALKEVKPELLEVMKKSLKNIQEFHEKQKQYSWFDSKPNGTILGQKVTALESAGVYVPGGKAAYPSSVLMNIIPAKVAGVDRIVMVTPPGKGWKGQSSYLDRCPSFRSH